MTKNKAMKTEQIDLALINPGRRERGCQDLGVTEYGP